MKRMVLGIVLFFLGGCSSVNQGGADAGGDATPDAVGPVDAGGDAAQPTGALGFTPSNIDLSDLDLTKAGDVILSDGVCVVLTEDSNIACGDANKDRNFVAKIMTLPDKSRLTVYVMRSLRIEASTILTANSGHLPFAIVALDSMTLLGSIKVVPGLAGGYWNGQIDMQGTGPGGGGGGPGSTKQGGGGASYCGIGGQGGIELNSAATPYPKSGAYGTPDLVPLLPGSAGGRGSGGGLTNGSGGGAIQLVAGKSIELKTGAFISAPGAGGGQGGLAADQEAAGGGSGGAILIEAPTVTIAGVLAANGGGGGGGAGGTGAGGQSGDPGHDQDATPASGGTSGGTGASGDTLDGANAAAGGTFTAPGGGGGAGRIRINTANGQAVVTSALVTPSAKTGCFTQGTLKQ